MLSTTLRTTATGAISAARPLSRTYAGAPAGSSNHPIRDSGKDLAHDAKKNSNIILFGTLAAIGGITLWWKTTDKTRDPYPEHPKNQKGAEPLQKPLGK